MRQPLAGLGFTSDAGIIGRESEPQVVAQHIAAVYVTQWLLSLADVALDPVPYGAGSSAYDVFSHDLPLVTLPRRYNAGRYVQACYRRMGVMDLVAATPEHYVEMAVRLGTDPDARGDARARIAQSSTVLFEDLDVVREHEEFFERAIAASRSMRS